MNRFFSAKSMGLVLLLTIVSLLAAACAGDVGPPGATGSAGAAGPEGPAGDAGAAGAKGDAGAAGAKGDAGAAGAKGDAGSAGSAGAAGSAGSSGAPGVPGAPGDTTFSAISVSGGIAYGTGWGDGESVDVDIVTDDGSTTSMGSVTANAGGIWTLDLSGSGLGVGGYSVQGTGDQGGKASGLYLVK